MSFAANRTGRCSLRSFSSSDCQPLISPGYTRSRSYRSAISTPRKPFASPALVSRARPASALPQRFDFGCGRNRPSAVGDKVTFRDARPTGRTARFLTNENAFGETIYSYSRAQAIADGVLVDLSHVDSIRQHWKHPFACTSAVWAIIEDALQRPDQDSCGICHDISTMAKLALRSAPAAGPILFSVIITGKKHAMKLHIGSGDTAAAVLTLMLPYEGPRPMPRCPFEH